MVLHVWLVKGTSVLFLERWDGQTFQTSCSMTFQLIHGDLNANGDSKFDLLAGEILATKKFAECIRYSSWWIAQRHQLVNKRSEMTVLNARCTRIAPIGGIKSHTAKPLRVRANLSRRLHVSCSYSNGNGFGPIGKALWEPSSKLFESCILALSNTISIYGIWWPSTRSSSLYSWYQLCDSLSAGL